MKQLSERRGWAIKGVLARSARSVAALCLFVQAVGSPVLADQESQVAPADTTGDAVVQWAYDSWTVPWVQTRGDPGIMAPSAYATLIALECAAAELERDRLARHLDPKECEHRMAAIRADQDTALIFSVDLEVAKTPISMTLVRLEPEVTLRLEDEHGTSWAPISVERGPVLNSETGFRVQRLYAPPWARGSNYNSGPRYGVLGGREVFHGKHRVRFARRDARTGKPVLDRGTRWLQLRLSYGGNEWVSMWAFRPEEVKRP